MAVFIDDTLNQIFKNVSREYDGWEWTAYDWQAAYCDDYQYHDDKIDQIVTVKGLPSDVDDIPKLLQLKPQFWEHVAKVKSAWETFLSAAKSILEDEPNEEYMHGQWEEHYKDDYDTYKEFEDSSDWHEIINDNRQMWWDDFHTEWSEFFDRLKRENQDLTNSYGNVLTRIVLEKLAEGANEIWKIWNELKLEEYAFLKPEERHEVVQDLMER